MPRANTKEDEDAGEGEAEAASDIEKYELLSLGWRQQCKKCKLGEENAACGCSGTSSSPIIEGVRLLRNFQSRGIQGGTTSGAQTGTNLFFSSATCAN